MAIMLKKMIKRFRRFYTLMQRCYPFASMLAALFIGRRGCLDHLGSTWSLLCRRPLVGGRPVNITIEPINICNLRCPVCETGNGSLTRMSRRMTLDEFKIIIEKVGSHTNTLMFYFMGEPFLNHEAYQMIRYAKEAKISWVTTCTNGDVVDPKQLVMSGIDEVSFQIGGVSQETHQVYRVNGNLKRVLAALKETIRLRREYEAKLRICSGFILMRHNEHEVDKFLQIMNEIGVDESIIVDPCVRNIEQGLFYLPKDQRCWNYDPHAFQEGILRSRFVPKNGCHWLYYSMVILANGDIVPCCRDPKGKYVMGNLIKDDLKDIWNGERYRVFRSRILKDQSQVDICRICSAYPASALK